MTRRKRKEIKKRRVAHPARPKIQRLTKAREEPRLNQRYINYLIEEHPEL
jgi:hypothetical protein